jgi:protein TonB
MSYAQRKEISGNRTLAAIFTVVVVSSLLYGIITGLAFNVIKKTVENLKVIDVEEQPPPPEEPPPPPKDLPKVPPPPMTPPPLVQMTAPPPPIQTVTTTNIPRIAPPPPTFSPPQPHLAQSATPARGDVRSSFNDDDYPESAQAAGAQGIAQARLSIGPDGRVTGCSLVRSTGNGALDSATCNVLKRRVKFIPARDSNGNAIASSYTTPQIQWVLPPE